MNAITVEQMRECERAAFARGISAESLMDQAGLLMAREIIKMFPTPSSVVAYLGKGHNAGDGLVVIRHLKLAGWHVSVRFVFPEIDCTVLTRKKWRECGETVDHTNENTPALILDGLLGIGAKGALRDPIRAAVQEMNALSERSYANTIALDLPTGINADTGEHSDACVIADHTFCIGFPKIGLLHSSAVNCVGRLHLIPLTELSTSVDSSGKDLICPAYFPQVMMRRPFDFHKGKAGRLAIVAGSSGMEGAALMSAASALRGGAGLVTLYVPSEIHASVCARALPELMVKVIDWKNIDSSKYDAMVIGPGLGNLTISEYHAFADFLSLSSCPCVLDADALNAIAHYQAHHLLQARHVITPHPGEFSRLAPESARRVREDACEHFTEYSPSVLLLKGARTLIMQRGSNLYHNSTGHPGMATAGMGDILSGLIGALMAQQVSPLHAACLGAWLCGRAAELALELGKQSPQSLIATDLLSYFGRAFTEFLTENRRLNQ